MKKTFVLTVSKQFPKTHNRAGQTTGFVENITRLFTPECKKIHTIRSNYELWYKRAKEISEGRLFYQLDTSQKCPIVQNRLKYADLKKLVWKNLNSLIISYLLQLRVK